MDKSLTLTFLTENGDKSTLTIVGIKDNLSDEEILSLMDTIIERKVFLSKNGLFIDSYSAKITTKETQKIDFKKNK